MDQVNNNNNKDRCILNSNSNNPKEILVECHNNYLKIKSKEVKINIISNNLNMND